MFRKIVFLQIFVLEFSIKSIIEILLWCNADEFPDNN